MSEAFEVVQAQTYDDLTAVQQIRLEVFVAENGYFLAPEQMQTLPPTSHLLPTMGEPTEAECEADDLDAVLFVVKSTEDGEVVGTVRFRRVDDSWKLSRMAILKPYRKYGLGRLLVQAGQEHIQSQVQSRTRLSCPSVIDAVPFYSKLGWTPYGEIYSIKEAQNKDASKLLHQGMEIYLEPL